MRFNPFYIYFLTFMYYLCQVTGQVIFETLTGKCLEVAVQTVIGLLEPIGGPGTTVEIDKSMFGKRKYNRGKRRDGFWKGVNAHPSYKTFQSSGYHNLVRLFASIPEIEPSWIRTWNRKVVNHSQFYKDPVMGVHTNTVEGMWAHSKRSLITGGRPKRPTHDCVEKEYPIGDHDLLLPEESESENYSSESDSDDDVDDYRDLLEDQAEANDAGVEDLKTVLKISPPWPQDLSNNDQAHTLREEYLKRTYNRLRPSPQKCQSARVLYDSCGWSQPSEDQMNFLNRSPTQQGLEAKLRQATNTSPGVDGLEYRHLRAIDLNCILLEEVCKMVWKLAIPNCWKTSRTFPIFKKRDTSDYSNFRPISLLPTIYKLFSRVISQRITQVASDLGWLYPEQKGFLPGVHGIQQHTQLLQTVVEETKTKRKHMSIALLDMCNAIGSVPHAILNELFTSLQIPEDHTSLFVNS
ncbi:Uncharacterized protein APZ42_025214 [Daphnia magna]|uniref:Uncharacterized protein n=1 Tax=Daphnia magna TaxID=35525 RepID=A0A164TC90_9CRUS|nr:Uncharacterized protein APZ42_025214 [Daphnia magna]